MNFITSPKSNIQQHNITNEDTNMSAFSRKRKKFRLRQFMESQKKLDAGKLNKEEITKLVESNWRRPFIQAKMQKCIDFLQEIELKSSLEQHQSYQDYLTLIAHKSLPKYNKLNGLPLGQSLKKSKEIFDEICKEIENFYIQLESSEQQILGHIRAHRKNLSLRQEVVKKLQYALEDKKAKEKNFKNSQKEMQEAIDGMKEEGKYKEEVPNFRKVLNYRMDKYKEDWKKYEHHGIGNYRRKKNRLKLYMSLELEKKRIEQMYNGL